MRRCFFVALIVLNVSLLYSQAYDPLHKPNSYRSEDNPNYWKNKMPNAAYWQQDVHYTIKANINENTDIIDGNEQLVYWNNSPDNLDYVFFHLYQNAFQPGSYLDELQKNNGEHINYGKYEAQKLGTTILKITINGIEIKPIMDNTIMKVELPQTLRSGESITFDIQFKTYFDSGSTRRRMKTFRSWDDRKQYDGVHWYPRIAVYDRKFGWTTDQHLGKEFYGDFGTYDVELTFASNFIVEATGNMTNRYEMLPEELRKKLAIENFKDKPWEEAPSIIIPYDSTQRKTWKFHAENVHDFAFTADPTYRIGEAVWNGIKCISLAQEQHASRWQNAADFTAKVVQVYSEDIGMYVYHKMIVADARDGMEYPMLTLDGGQNPSYKFLLAHEVGHNWFYGQIGNNETYRASLDEGFTQFLSAWSLNKLVGDTSPDEPLTSNYLLKYKNPRLVMEQSVYSSYLRDAIRFDDPALNTHSDDFNGAIGHGGGYRQVYYKTATMLYNLQYVLGDELFLDAMKYYFNTWKIAHPYPNDFRDAIIHYTHVDLNWFFDQWLETTKRIDYTVQSVKKGEGQDEYIISFKRKERMQMPIDFEVVAKDGKKYAFHIPNTWFVKKTDATVLPKWSGWDKLYPTYKATVTIPSGIDNVIIDPSGRLTDVFQLDNSKKIPLLYSFDHQLENTPDFRNYEVFARPDVWYNGYDGLKTGLHINGNYMKYIHEFDVNLWLNSGLFKHNWGELIDTQNDRVSFRFNYKTALDKCIKGTSISLSAMHLDGLKSYKMTWNIKSSSRKSNFFTSFKVMQRKENNDINYLLYPDEWQPKLYNNTINVGINHNYNFRNCTGDVQLELKTSALGSNYDYSYLSLTAVNAKDIGKLTLNTRTFLQIATGSKLASESALYFAGGNPEEMMDNKYTRSIGFVPENWTGYNVSTNHFQYGGGLNVRGYAGYLIAQDDKYGNVYTVYKSHSGAAINAELEFNKLIKYNPRFLHDAIHLTTYLFGDAGIITYNELANYYAFSDIRADAGIGAALTIQKWGVLEKVKPLTIRFDVPLFLNRAPYLDAEYIKFRWIIGIERAFTIPKRTH